MKPELIIISVVMTLIVFLPFYLLPLLQLTGYKKSIRLFKTQAELFRLNTDIMNSWNLNITGIDSAAQKLLVLQLHEEIKVRYFDLKNVKHTDMHVSTLPVIKSGKTENILQKVDIEFTFYTGEDKETLCLYDYDFNTYQDFEVKNAEKLQKDIQRLVMAHPIIKRTA